MIVCLLLQVCSAWIAGGIARDLNDVRRIQQLLVTKLSKVGQAKDSSLQLYNEAATTMEKLAVLKAWAEVILFSMNIKTDLSRLFFKHLKGQYHGDSDAFSP